MPGADSERSRSTVVVRGAKSIVRAAASVTVLDRQCSTPQAELATAPEGPLADAPRDTGTMTIAHAMYATMTMLARVIAATVPRASVRAPFAAVLTLPRRGLDVLHGRAE
jgi:hypothetical protein